MVDKFAEMIKECSSIVFFGGAGVSTESGVSIIDTLTVFIAVLASSSLILINQYKGAKNKEKENKVYY